MKIRKIISIIMCFIAISLLFGCSSGRSGAGEGQSDIAIHAGDTDIEAYEMRYYAYKTQATYEVYYMSQEKELDWNSKLTGDVTLFEGVKSEILNGICKRQALYEMSKQLKIELTETQKAEVRQQVEYYFENSGKKMLDKIQISKEQLMKVFEKEKVADLVVQEKGEEAAETIYEQWKQENSVTTEKIWDKLNFDERLIEK